MQKRVIGLIAGCLAALLTGCASSNSRPALMLCECQEVPPHLTSELPAPEVILQNNKGLLLLLAEYEAMRRRFNADRATVVEILANDAGDE